MVEKQLPLGEYLKKVEDEVKDKGFFIKSVHVHVADDKESFDIELLRHRAHREDRHPSEQT